MSIAQANEHPTLQRTVPTFITILWNLKCFTSSDNPPELQSASNAAYKLMYKYYKKTLLNRASIVVIILDSYYKALVFTYLEESSADDLRIYNKALDVFKSVYN